MATITLDYDARNINARKTLDYILSMGFFKIKKQKTSLEKAFEDIEKGRVHRLITPKRLAVNG
ncbi:MAG: hypothetical protein LBE91_05770 [Tannerella sp.]|jgi:hypothetical protein|nr:hypothetical protein [Tannerella sp.]